MAVYLILFTGPTVCYASADSSTVLYNKALELFMTGERSNANAAKDLLNNAIVQDSLNRDAHWLLGAIFASIGEWQRAINEFDRAIAVMAGQGIFDTHSSLLKAQALNQSRDHYAALVLLAEIEPRLTKGGDLQMHGMFCKEALYAYRTACIGIAAFALTLNGHPVIDSCIFLPVDHELFDVVKRDNDIGPLLMPDTVSPIWMNVLALPADSTNFLKYAVYFDRLYPTRYSSISKELLDADTSFAGRQAVIEAEMKEILPIKYAGFAGQSRQWQRVELKSNDAQPLIAYRAPDAIEVNPAIYLAARRYIDPAREFAENLGFEVSQYQVFPRNRKHYQLWGPGAEGFPAPGEVCERCATYLFYPTQDGLDILSVYINMENGRIVGYIREGGELIRIPE